MKLDTNKNGLNAVFKFYEVAALEELMSHEERVSGEVWRQLRSDGVDISRASVIFFLNRLVEAGLVNYRLATGKGGHHRIYSLIPRSWDEFNDMVIDKFLYKLWEIFPSSEKMTQVIKI
jgi:predicted transcriptional regulator